MSMVQLASCLICLIFCTCSCSADLINDNVATRTYPMFHDIATRSPYYYSLDECRRNCKAQVHEQPLCLKRVRSTSKEYMCCKKITRLYYSRECNEAMDNDTGPCASDPCNHGGSCYNVGPWVAGYKCTCKITHTGKDCETPKELERGWCLPGSSGSCKYGKCYKLTETRPLTELLETHLTTLFNSLSPFMEVFPSEIIEQMEHVLNKTSVYRRPVASTSQNRGKTFEESICFCQPGYRGFKCDLECPPRRWAPYCLGSCGIHCLECEPTGECSVCRKGHTSPDDSGNTLHCSRRPCADFCERGICTEPGIQGQCRCHAYYVGQWCDRNCTTLPWPSWGEVCGMLCGKCYQQPCDVNTGRCTSVVFPNNTVVQCQEGFQGIRCDYLEVEGEEMFSIDTLVDVNFVQYDTQFDPEATYNFLTDMYFHDLLDETEDYQTLQNEVAAHLEATFDHEVVEKMKKFNLLGGAGIRKRRQTRQSGSSERGVRVEFTVQISPARVKNIKTAQQVVVQKLKDNSNKFQSQVVHALQIDTSSIRIKSAKIVSVDIQSGSNDPTLVPRYALVTLLCVSLLLAGMLLLLLVLFRRRRRKANNLRSKGTSQFQQRNFRTFIVR